MIYPWQINSWKKIQKLYNLYHNSLLIHGSIGIGKLHFARYLSKSILCNNKCNKKIPCEKCINCNWISNNTHPNFKFIHPKILKNTISIKNTKIYNTYDMHEKEIKIKQIYSLLNFINTKSNKKNIKIIIIYPIENLNIFSSNALLKSIEEPPKNTLFLLISSNIEKVSKTITSRCIKFFMKQPKFIIALDWLKKKINNPINILHESGGLPLLAIFMTQDKDRPILINILNNLTHGKKCNILMCNKYIKNIPIKKIIDVIQKWVYEIIIQHSIKKPYFFPEYSNKSLYCSYNTNLYSLTSLMKNIIKEKKKINNISNNLLIFEKIILNYKKIFI